MRRLSYVLAAAFLSPQQITFCHVHIFTNHFHVLLTYEYQVLLLICKLKNQRTPQLMIDLRCSLLTLEKNLPYDDQNR